MVISFIFILLLAALMPKTLSVNSFLPTKMYEEHKYIKAAKKNQREIMCLAKNIYYEANGEPFEGKIAVGVVTLNRLISNKFPNSICSVVYQKFANNSGDTVCQFQWTCNSNLLDHKPAGFAWKDSLQIANILLNQGYYVYHKMVDGALFFHSAALPFSWDKQHRRVAKIGQHIFYKPKR